MQIHECHSLVLVLQVAHGNEDTFREMLRIRRSVAASFSQTHFNTTIIDAATAPVTTGQYVLQAFVSFLPIALYHICHAMLHSLCCAVLFCAVQCCVVLCGAVLRCAALCNS